MMNVKLLRLDDKEGTWGVLLIEGAPFCLTVERPWADNQPNVSCIPEGSYKCKRDESPQFGWTFEVQDVPGRSLIKFHWGSFVRNYKGCIGLGARGIDIDGEKALYSTKTTFNAFMKRMEGVDEFDLEIRYV